MDMFGISPESYVYILSDFDSDKEEYMQVQKILNSSPTVYGDGMTGEVKLIRRENNTPLRLLVWKNDYGEFGGLRCTDDTVIYIIRDGNMVFCPVKDIRVGDTLPVRYKHEISISAKIMSNSPVSYIDRYVYSFENKDGLDSMIVNDAIIILKREGEQGYEECSRMVAD